MPKGLPEFVAGPHDDVEPGIEVRPNPDGTIDEIVTHQPVRFHLEQMDDGAYWIGLDWTDEGGEDRHQAIWLQRHGKHIFPTVYR